MQSIAEIWSEYEERVVPADAGEVQRVETKQAFYSGVGSILHAQLQMTGEDLTDDQCTDLLTSWLDEFNDYVKSRIVQK